MAFTGMSKVVDRPRPVGVSPSRRRTVSPGGSGYNVLAPPPPAAKPAPKRSPSPFAWGPSSPTVGSPKETTTSDKRAWLGGAKRRSTSTGAAPHSNPISTSPLSPPSQRKSATLASGAAPASGKKKIDVFSVLQKREEEAAAKAKVVHKVPIGRRDSKLFPGSAATSGTATPALTGAEKPAHGDPFARDPRTMQRYQESIKKRNVRTEEPTSVPPHGKRTISPGGPLRRSLAGVMGIPEAGGRPVNTTYRPVAPYGVS